MEGEITDRLVVQEELLERAEDEDTVALGAGSRGPAESVDVCDEFTKLQDKRLHSHCSALDGAPA